MPLYPLYALLFADSGLSGARISALFAIWSATGLLAEVPTGALADRVSRRGALVAAGVLQAGGYAVWVLLPTFPGFAAGFVLWGLGGSLVSGAREALLFDGLAAVGAEAEYARVNGWVSAAVLVAGLPAAATATVLFAAGGYGLVGWVSVGVCLAAAAVAARLPEPARTDPDDPDDPDDAAGCLATLRAGLSAAARAGVRPLVAAAALVGSVDSLEEYFPLITADLGVPAVAVPLAMVPIGLAGAVGAALGGRASRLRPGALALVLGTGMLLLGLAGLVEQPVALAAVAVFYAAYQAVLVAVDARLQARIGSGSRATVTSVAGLGVDIASFGLYAAWALGEVSLIAALGALVAALLPRLLRAVRY